jgi:DNA-binding protein YbaB
MDFSGLGELMNNLKKAQDLALEAEKFNKEFAQQSFQGKDSRGLVTATFNGMAEPTGISFTDSVLQLGKETVAAATMEALAQGHLKAKNAAMQRLQSIMTMPRSMREAAFGNQEGFGGPPGGDVSGGGEETEAGDDVK